MDWPDEAGVTDEGASTTVRGARLRDYELTVLEGAFMRLSIALRSGRGEIAVAVDHGGREEELAAALATDPGGGVSPPSSPRSDPRDPSPGLVAAGAAHRRASSRFARGERPDDIAPATRADPREAPSSLEQQRKMGNPAPACGVAAERAGGGGETQAGGC